MNSRKKQVVSGNGRGDSEPLKYRIDEWLVLKFGSGMNRKRALANICTHWGMSSTTLLRYRRAKIGERHLNLSYQRLKWLQNYLELKRMDDLVTKRGSGY